MPGFAIVLPLVLLATAGARTAPAPGARTAPAPGVPSGLLCELLRDPARAAITDLKPDFGWIVNDDRPGAVQGSYQILVASRRDLLDGNSGDLWDTGRRRSRQSINVGYAGKPLDAGRTYLWKVRTWDAAGRASPWSEPQSFHTSGFSTADRAFPGESRWVPGAAGAGELVLENRQAGRLHEIEPVSVAAAGAGPGGTFADFGRAAFATLRFVATAPAAGAKVTAYLGERRGDGDVVHKQPGKSHIGFATQVVDLRPGEAEYTVTLPRHRARMPHSQVLPDHLPEVTPFRYAELVPSDPNVRLARLRQVALLHPFDDAASAFVSSDERLDRVWQLCKHTLKAAPFLSLYADGNRERMPYEADAYIQHLGHLAVDREFAVGRYTNQFLLWNPSWPTEWQMHAVFAAHADYMHTGDTEHLAANYEHLRAKTLLALVRADGLISTSAGDARSPLATDAVFASLHLDKNHKQTLRDIVDWPPGERDSHVFVDVNTVVNAFHYRSLVLMETIARALGKPADAKDFARRAGRVATSINAKLFDPTRGIYRDGEGTDHASLHANMFPLVFGLVPERHRATVVAHVKSRGMACSVYGAQYLLEALFDVGEDAYALSLMTSDGRRSWLNMLRVGSTMTTEAWDEIYKRNLTWNHAWGSAPANIVARKLAGVEPLEPGFGVMRIRPRPGGLASFSLTMPTIRGPVTVAFRADGGRSTLDVTIPANTRAEIWLPWAPAARPLQVAAGKHRFESR